MGKFFAVLKTGGHQEFSSPPLLAEDLPVPSSRSKPRLRYYRRRRRRDDGDRSAPADLLIETSGATGVVRPSAVVGYC